MKTNTTLGNIARPKRKLDCRGCDVFCYVLFKRHESTTLEALSSGSKWHLSVISSRGFIKLSIQSTDRMTLGGLRPPFCGQTTISNDR